MMGITLLDAIGDILREIAADIIIPRFRTLAAADIDEKSPGDIVTIADREAEAAIAPRLVALLPDSRVVGEEACAVDPSLSAQLDEGIVWLVDPLDGTANFAEGKAPFSTMVALLKHGQTVAAWMLDPLSGRLAVAEQGSGAWDDEGRIVVPPGSPGVSQLRGAIFGHFMPEDVRRDVMARASSVGETIPGLMCCGAEYPAIARGDEHFALFWSTLPWDHAPGVLFLTEAGGRAARPDKSPYLPASGQGGLLAARNADVWADVHAALLR